jgi:fructokinase
MRIGIDLGGTKIEAIALDDAGGELLRRRVPNPRTDYEEIVGAIAGLVSWVETELGAEGSVGVGHPGTISPATGLIKNSNSTMLLGRPLDRDLARALDRPVRLANDARGWQPDLRSQCDRRRVGTQSPSTERGGAG